MRGSCLLLLSLLVSVTAPAEEPAPAPSANPLVSLLEQGPVAQVFLKADGSFGHAVSIIDIPAPRDVVWRAILDFEHYKDFMPQVEESEIVGREGSRVDLELEIEVPGINYTYTMAHVPHPEQYLLRADWIEGDIEGAWAEYQLEEAGPELTLLHYSTTAQMPWMIRKLEDENQTITTGVSLATVIGVARAVKRRVMELQAKPAPPTETK